MKPARKLTLTLKARIDPREIATCMSPQFWLGLQMDYDLDVEEDRLAQRLVREVRTYASGA